MYPRVEVPRRDGRGVRVHDVRELPEQRGEAFAGPGVRGEEERQQMSHVLGGDRHVRPQPVVVHGGAGAAGRRRTTVARWCHWFRHRGAIDEVDEEQGAGIEIREQRLDGLRVPRRVGGPQGGHGAGPEVRGAVAGVRAAEVHPRRAACEAGHESQLGLVLHGIRAGAACLVPALGGCHGTGCEANRPRSGGPFPGSGRGDPRRRRVQRVLVRRRRIEIVIAVGVGVGVGVGVAVGTERSETRGGVAEPSHALVHLAGDRLGVALLRGEEDGLLEHRGAVLRGLDDVPLDSLELRLGELRIPELVPHPAHLLCGRYHQELALELPDETLGRLHEGTTEALTAAVLLDGHDRQLGETSPPRGAEAPRGDHHAGAAQDDHTELAAIHLPGRRGRAGEAFRKSELVDSLPRHVEDRVEEINDRFEGRRVLGRRLDDLEHQLVGLLLPRGLQLAHRVPVLEVLVGVVALLRAVPVVVALDLLRGDSAVRMVLLALDMRTADAAHGAHQQGPGSEAEVGGAKVDGTTVHAVLGRLVPGRVLGDHGGA